MKLVTPIKQGDKVRLDAYDTEPGAHLREEEGKERLLKLSAELGKLQRTAIRGAAEFAADHTARHGHQRQGRDHKARYV